MTEWLQDDERHPPIYNEFDIERARIAGKQHGERAEQARILALLTTKIAELRESGDPDPSEQERALTWAVKLIRGTDD